MITRDQRNRQIATALDNQGLKCLFGVDFENVLNSAMVGTLGVATSAIASLASGRSQDTGVKFTFSTLAAYPQGSRKQWHLRQTQPAWNS